MSNLQSELETDRVEELPTLTGEIIDDRGARLELRDPSGGELEHPENSADELDRSSEESIPATGFPQWLKIGAAAIAVVGGVWFFLNRPTEHPVAETAANPPIQVSTQVVSPQAIGGTQALTGSVEAVEAVTTTSRVVGQIISLPVKEGDYLR